MKHERPSGARCAEHEVPAGSLRHLEGAPVTRRWAAVRKGNEPWVSALGAAVCLGLWSSTALAQTTQDEPNDGAQRPNETVGASAGEWELRRPPRRSATDYRSDQFGAIELRFGPYRPNVDKEFDGGATPYEDIFGTKRRLHIGLEVDWQALRIPYLGSLGPGIQVAYTRASGKAPLTNQDGFSDEDTSLWIVPISALAVLRVDVLAQRLNIPFVPYVKAGLTYALWGSSTGGTTARHEGVTGRGAEIGYQGAVGLMFWLNILHPQSALDMDNATGINNSYIYGELFMSDVDSFGSGMQVGTSTWVAGLAFEF